MCADVIAIAPVLTVSEERGSRPDRWSCEGSANAEPSSSTTRADGSARTAHFFPGDSEGMPNHCADIHLAGGGTGPQTPNQEWRGS
jgi:hypothetical protein